MKSETKDTLGLLGVIGTIIGGGIALAVLDEKAGGPEFRLRQQKAERKVLEARQAKMLDEARRNRRARSSRSGGNLFVEMANLLDDSTSSLLVGRIKEMDSDWDRRRLLRDWVQSGRRIDPIQASDIRSSFDWPRGSDDDLLSVACGAKAL